MQCCFLVPIYNHHETIRATVENLLSYSLPIFIIDDGSDQMTQSSLEQLAHDYPESVRLHRLPENAGKGAAVMAGFFKAATSGMTHALQIDADGQHNTSDIPAFLKAMESEPNALISGWPQYDESIPLSRKFGRQITHFWVYIETLSLSIKDTMCGFRVYPLRETLDAMETKRIGTRMDFDIDIMVRMYWRAVPVRFVKTRVIYPQGGRSHFRGFADNWRITKMHTRLFFGMLVRMPVLLVRKLKRST